MSWPASAGQQGREAGPGLRGEAGDPLALKIFEQQASRHRQAAHDSRELYRPRYLLSRRRRGRDGSAVPRLVSRGSVREHTVLRAEQARAASIALVPDLDMAGARGSAIAAHKAVLRRGGEARRNCEAKQRGQAASPDLDRGPGIRRWPHCVRRRDGREAEPGDQLGVAECGNARDALGGHSEYHDAVRQVGAVAAAVVGGDGRWRWRWPAASASGPASPAPGSPVRHAELMPAYQVRSGGASSVASLRNSAPARRRQRSGTRRCTG